MGWADDMYEAGYTSNHGGPMDSSGYRRTRVSNKVIAKEKFVVTKREEFCNIKEMKVFVDQLAKAWKTNGRTQEEIHERCLLLIEDAKSIKLKIDCKAVFGLALRGILKQRGYFLEEGLESRIKIDPAYL